MDKDQEKIASGEQGHAATCGPSPGPGCSVNIEAAKIIRKVIGMNIENGATISMTQRQIDECWKAVDMLESSHTQNTVLGQTRN